MTNEEKLHRILEFLAKEKVAHNKSRFSTKQISKAFNTKLNDLELIALCRTLIENGDVKECTSNSG